MLGHKGTRRVGGPLSKFSVERSLSGGARLVAPADGTGRCVAPQAAAEWGAGPPSRLRVRRLTLQLRSRPQPLQHPSSGLRHRHPNPRHQQQIRRQRPRLAAGTTGTMTRMTTPLRTAPPSCRQQPSRPARRRRSRRSTPPSATPAACCVSALLPPRLWKSGCAARPAGSASTGLRLTSGTRALTTTPSATTCARAALSPEPAPGQRLASAHFTTPAPHRVAVAGVAARGAGTRRAHAAQAAGGPRQAGAVVAARRQRQRRRGIRLRLLVAVLGGARGQADRGRGWRGRARRSPRWRAARGGGAPPQVGGGQVRYSDQVIRNARPKPGAHRKTRQTFLSVSLREIMPLVLVLCNTGAVVHFWGKRLNRDKLRHW